MACQPSQGLKGRFLFAILILSGLSIALLIHVLYKGKYINYPENFVDYHCTNFSIKVKDAKMLPVHILSMVKNCRNETVVHFHTTKTAKYSARVAASISLPLVSIATLYIGPFQEISICSLWLFKWLPLTDFAVISLSILSLMILFVSDNISWLTGYDFVCHCISALYSEYGRIRWSSGEKYGWLYLLARVYRN